MIYSTHLTTTGETLVFTSSSTGAPISGAVTGQTTAITTIAICNIGAPNLTDETINSANITINLLGIAPNNVSTAANTVVKNLTVPAGETLFFNDERIVLDSGNTIRATASAANLLSITVSAIIV